MKLPEHYEKWMDEEFEDEPPRRGGARSMYHKLMEDLKPAIEAVRRMYMGYCGMFGYPWQSKEDHAWELGSEMIKEAYDQLDAKGFIKYPGEEKGLVEE